MSLTGTAIKGAFLPGRPAATVASTSSDALGQDHGDRCPRRVPSGVGDPREAGSSRRGGGIGGADHELINAPDQGTREAKCLPRRYQATRLSKAPGVLPPTLADTPAPDGDVT